jgi:hypothetical protein
MRSPSDRPGRTEQDATATDERDLYIHVQGEFRSMPGLTLTVRQAARLFSIEQSRCERVLGALVNDGVLATNGSIFARTGSGRGCG